MLPKTIYCYYYYCWIRMYVEYLYVVHFACFPGFIHIKTTIEFSFCVSICMAHRLKLLASNKNQHKILRFQKKSERNSSTWNNTQMARGQMDGKADGTRKESSKQQSSKINYRLCTASFFFFSVFLAILLSCCNFAS